MTASTLTLILERFHDGANLACLSKIKTVDGESKASFSKNLTLQVAAAPTRVVVVVEKGDGILRLEGEAKGVGKRKLNGTDDDDGLQGPSAAVLEGAEIHLKCHRCNDKDTILGS